MGVLLPASSDLHAELETRDKGRGDVEEGVGVTMGIGYEVVRKDERHWGV
jgi:hypothetical protein